MIKKSGECAQNIEQDDWSNSSISDHGGSFIEYVEIELPLKEQADKILPSRIYKWI